MLQRVSSSSETRRKTSFLCVILLHIVVLRYVLKKPPSTRCLKGSTSQVSHGLVRRDVMANSTEYTENQYIEKSGREDQVFIPVLGVMVINREDLLVDMLRSIDVTVENLVIFHNADSDELINKKMRRTIEDIQIKRVDLGHSNIKSITSLYRLNNLGFSAGVNRIVSSAPTARFWLIVSNDVAFHPGILHEVAQTMAANDDDICLWGLVGDPSSPYASFVLTPRAVQTIGLFDENFWPAYAEDCDYTARLVRGDCPIRFEPNSDRIASHITSASWKTTRSTSNLASLVRQTGRGHNNFDYLIEKWGVNVCELRTSTPPYMDSAKGFAKPFDDSRAELSSWSVNMDRRRSRTGPQDCVVCNSSHENHE